MKDEIKEIFDRHRLDHARQLEALQLDVELACAALKEFKEKYRAERQQMNEQLNHPTAHSIMARRKRFGYVLRAKIKTLLSDLGHNYYDFDNSTIHFDLEGDKLELHISIPFKKSEIE
jgi:hypothetical protein